MKYLLLILPLITQVAFAGRICVSNLSQQELDWTVKDSRGGVVDTEYSHSSKTRWRCATVNERKDPHFTLRVSPTQKKFLSPSCYQELKTSDWVIVKSGAQGLECVVENKQGESRNTDYQNILEKEDLSLVTRVDFGGALFQSRAQIVDAQSRVLSASEQDTFGTGVYQIPIKGINLSGRLFVEVLPEEGPFKLSAVIPLDFDYELASLGVNLATTLVAELVKDGHSLSKAQQMVREFFRASPNMDLSLMSVSQELIQTLQSADSFDKALDQLVSDVERNRRPQQISASLDPSDILDPAKSIVIDQGKKYITNYFEDLARNAFSGPGKEIAKAGAGALLNLIFPGKGSKDRTAEELKRINQKLEEQTRLLVGIQTQIQILQGMMGEVMQMLKELLDNQERNHFEQMNANLMAAVSAIDAQYEMLNDIVKTGVTEDQNKFNLLVNSILEPTHTAMYMNQIHMMLTADQGFGRPLLSLYRELVIKKAKAHGPRFYANDYLLPINQFYGFYYRAQLKALNLLVEANNSLPTSDTQSSQRLVELFKANTTKQLAMVQLPSVNLENDNLIVDMKTKKMWIKKPTNFANWQTSLTWRSFLPESLPHYSYADFKDWKLASEEDLSSLFKDNQIFELIKTGFELENLGNIMFIRDQDQCVYDFPSAKKECGDYARNDLALPYMVRNWTQNPPP